MGSNITFISYPSTGRRGQHTHPVLYQQPTTFLQTFSYSATRALEFTDSALRYYVTSPSGVSLRYGYERWIKRPEGPTRLDPILLSIQRVVEKTNTASGAGKGKEWLNGMAVVTWRGIMTKILIAPYQEWDTVELNAMLIGGTLYLEEHVPDSRVPEMENIPAKQRKLMYDGFAFEAWSTSSQPGVPERLEGHPVGWGGDVNTNIQWAAVAETRLGDHRLLISGEIDCVRRRFEGKPGALVELKATMSMRTQNVRCPDLPSGEIRLR
ncbi:hypothetical protein OH76DRAFT_1359108 [Lentinus brumalis]|uniref:Decapping nuclease n=1 Tax=Lentinus brumalis TaxID=2498619 RepID=A0A371CWN0_9APHY|nr:hypothetical protein OH76DRAFT_1359108 [Polyporus brumalis]